MLKGGYTPLSWLLRRGQDIFAYYPKSLTP